MLPAAPDYAHPVPGPDGVALPHEGWDDGLPEPRGWSAPVPSVVCRPCGDRGVPALLVVTEAIVTGGRYSIIWVAACETCGARRFYPATDHGAAEAAAS